MEASAGGSKDTVKNADLKGPCGDFGELLQEPEGYNSQDRQDGAQSSIDPGYELLDQLLSPVPLKEIYLGIYETLEDFRRENRMVKFCMNPLRGDVVIYITRSSQKQIQSPSHKSSDHSGEQAQLSREMLLYSTFYRKKLSQIEISLAISAYDIFSTFQDAIKNIEDKQRGAGNLDEDTCASYPSAERNTSRILASLLACTSYRTALSKNIFVSSKLAHGLGETGLACRVMFLLERIYFRRVLYAESKCNIDASLWRDLCVWIDLGRLSNDCDSVDQLKENLRNYNPEMFWPLVYGSLLTGKLSLARSILYCHPNYFYVQNSSRDEAAPMHPSPYSFLSIIIKYAPIPESDCEEYVESTAKWREFLEEHVSQGLIAGIESYEERLYFLKAIEILRGTESVIMETASSWRDALLGLYLYTYRGADTLNFNTILDRVRHLAPNTILDAIEMAILSQDLRMAISLCSKAGWWFAPHVMDVIYNTAMFKQSFSFSKKIASKLSINDAITEMRDWYIFHYSELLLICPSLWHIALEYLSHCTQCGKSFCSSVIRVLFIDSHVSLKRVLAFCRRHNLENDAKEVLRIFRSWRRPLPMHKLLYKLQEPPTVENFLSCQELLKAIVPPNSNDDVIQSILDSAIPECHSQIMKSRLTMLCVHAMLVLQINREDYSRAIESIFRILDIRYFPIWSSYILRNDIMKLLSEAPDLFTNASVLEILRHINTLPELPANKITQNQEEVRTRE